MTLKELEERPSAAARKDARREQLLGAATEVFFKSGFAGASVDDVIAKVGGSKRTIYSYFGNKEQLFATIVEEISRRAMGPLADEDMRRESLEATLCEVGRRYIAVIMSPEALQLYRTIIGEGIRFPQLAKIFFEAGPGRASATLASVLQRMATAWGIHDENYKQLAEHFLGMIRDDLHLQVVLGLRPPPTEEEAEIAVRTAVKLFLRGVHPER
ncbi:TetR/AcrR family transcriptional regulator [Bradyrhizobium sp. LHD-71]|uniref:TetR/AcrR family transcriptional regulator n=1 Tax=Bradyrhizobium sp. LHD-71 TaxID=3072141 RepID=UPI00280D59B3|nr:TetR/AcrR family transcriptional regulator [Bradyrhizobium sp. LHD-71]MDQ8730630.1 TetR/AcrR family transcriptional regulator [Bradyrhizobium sp. LHD-71]